MSNIRFCQSNLLQAATSLVAAGSTLAGFPIGNAYDTYRFSSYRTGGLFEMAATNNLLYLNDGSDKTATITVADYASGALLAAQIQTQLNAVSTNWTCTYSTTTGKFTIGRSSGTALFRLTQTTNAIWDIIGFTGAVDDDVGVGQLADVRRNHTSEIITVDLGAALECRAMHMIGGAGENFAFSTTAVVTLIANNIPVYTGAPLSVVFAPETLGVFKYLEVADYPSTTYRYWRVKLVDRENPNGPNFPINQMYIGSYVSPANRTINIGLQRTLVNESRFFTTDGGVRYARRVPVYERYSSTQVEFLIDDDRLEIERVFREVGTTEPMFISYDPTAIISNSVGEFTKYMQIENADVKHQLYKYHTVDFAAREVI